MFQAGFRICQTTKKNCFLFILQSLYEIVALIPQFYYRSVNDKYSALTFFILLLLKLDPYRKDPDPLGKRIRIHWVKCDRSESPVPGIIFASDPANPAKAPGILIESIPVIGNILQYTNK